MASHMNRACAPVCPGVPRLVRLAALAGLLSLLAACGGVQIKPDPNLPEALIDPAPARVGLVIPGDMRNFVHTETRWGVEWKIELGPGHVHLMHDVFNAAFREVQEFPDLESARAATGLKAIFEPRLEQYSFVTARETGGRYYAVTMRYRINLYTGKGEPVDSYTLTGYGNALAKGISSGGPLQIASIAAMRDAAAKFLVQFPEQPAGITLAKNEPVVAEETPAQPGEISTIEAVPIDEPKQEHAAVPPPAPRTADPQSEFAPARDTGSAQ